MWKKTFAICQWKTLEDVKEVHTFLGLCGQWRKFVPNYVKIANPLYKLLEKAQFEWNEETEAAFQNVKQCLTSAAILGHPDTSNVVVGGALLQEHSLRSLNPITYFSWTLTQREQGYSTYNRKAFTICNTLQHFSCKSSSFLKLSTSRQCTSKI